MEMVFMLKRWICANELFKELSWQPWKGVTESGRHLLRENRLHLICICFAARAGPDRPSALTIAPSTRVSVGGASVGQRQSPCTDVSNPRSSFPSSAVETLAPFLHWYILGSGCVLCLCGSIVVIFRGVWWLGNGLKVSSEFSVLWNRSNLIKRCRWNQDWGLKSRVESWAKIRPVSPRWNFRVNFFFNRIPKVD